MVRRVLAVLLLLPLLSVGQGFEEFQTTRANVRLSATNVGTFGNAFRGYRDGSCEGEGHEEPSYIPCSFR